MAYSTYLGELAYVLTLDKTRFDQGMTDAQKKIKTFEQNVDQGDKKIAALTRTANTAGRSLISLGGTATVAGTAIGGDLGKSIQEAGMAAFGAGALIDTLKDGLKLVGVSGLSASQGLSAIGGPALIVGLGATVVAITKLDDALYLAEKRAGNLPKSFDALTDKVKDADDALKSYIDHLNEIRDIPKDIESLQFERKGLGLDLFGAGVDLDEAIRGGDQYKIAQAKYRRDTIERQLLGVDAEIEALRKKPAALAPVMWAEEVRARGITTGAISQPYAGYYSATQGAPREGPLGGVMDFLMGRQPGGIEKIPAGGYYDQYGAPRNFLYNRQMPDVTININGTVSDASFKIPGDSLLSQAERQGY